MELAIMGAGILYLTGRVLLDLAHRFSCWFIEED